jgi:hypothetical protein
MKAWQILAVGLMVLCALFFVQAYIRFVPALAAIAMVAAVIAGFCFVPDKDLWVVWITTYSVSEDADTSLDVYSEQEPIAIRTHVARLWLLYLPTVAAVAYFASAAATGRVPSIEPYFSVPALYAVRAGVLAVWFLLGSWLYERWLLHRAEAAQLHGDHEAKGTDSPYYFTVGTEYYGGTDFTIFSYRKEPILARVVMYRRANPSRSRMVAAFLFHRFDVAVRGVQDLEAARETSLAKQVAPL